MKKPVILIIAAVMLTACAQTPRNIENNSRQPESSSASEPQGTGTVTSPQSDQSYISQIKTAKLDNITVADDFMLDTGAPEDIGVYQAVLSNDFDKNSKSLFSEYFSSYSHENEVVGTSEISGRYVQYEDEKSFAVISSIGSFFISDKNCLNKVMYGTNIRYEQTDLVNSNKPVSYTIGDKTVTLENILAAGEKAISEFIRASEFPNALRPFAFSTQILDNGKTAGTLHCRNYYKGLPVFDAQPSYEQYTNKIATLAPSTVTFVDGAQVGQLASAYALSEGKKLEPAKSIISPVQAVTLTSKKLSGHMNCRLKYQELVYFPTCIGNVSQNENGNGTACGDILKLTPCWVLYFDTSWWHESLAVVNALTGEVDYVNNAR